MPSDIQTNLMRADQRRLLRLLLQDKTSKKNILWGTDTYAELGPAYAHNCQITPELITGKHCYLIRSRAQKRQDQQSARTKTHAEVFTPMWVCSMMNDAIDDEWFGSSHVFFDEQGNRTDRVVFPEGVKNRTWRDYVTSKRLEITCGEAPYLVSRYDVATGESVDIDRRIGMLDRKLRVVDENTADEGEWMRWALRALQSTFGYEFQGDNLLIARLNVLATFEEYLGRRWHREATTAELRKVVNIIAWNIWQMDGLTYRIPFDDSSDDAVDLFEAMGVDDAWGQEKSPDHTPRCRVYKWSSNRSETLVSAEGKVNMKFDYIIGNPPYQEETESDSARKPPIYNYFMDSAYSMSTVSEFITPARFLFRGGYTPENWDRKMLNDPHLKVIDYWEDSSEVFTGVDIKGGIVITLHNNDVNFGAIQIFTKYPQLKSIAIKVSEKDDGSSLQSIIRSPLSYKITAKMAQDYPNLVPRLRTSAFSKLAPIFFKDLPTNAENYIQLVGLSGNVRERRYVRSDYIEDAGGTLDKFTVLLPKANGTGKFGETFSSSEIAEPGVGYLQTFIGIGAFEDETSAINLQKYLKSKFVRCLLGVLKVTQDNPAPKWQYVPLQDFTSASDIDWGQSVADIDKQLYKKYGLSDEEIDFIEKNVKEMK